MLSGRPHVDAAALLAAHGHALAPLRTGVRLMDAMTRFAFIAHSDAGVAKPFVFPDVHALARHVERRREGRAIELVDAEDVEVPGRDALQVGVQVYLLGMDNARDRPLGWAWLDGQGRERFEPALRTARQDLARQQRKAA